MGISTKKTTQQTTQNQNTNMTTTPINPGFVTGGLEAAGNRITDFFRDLDPSKLVAGPDALQTQAATAARGLTTSPNFGVAGDIFRSVAGRGANTYDPSMIGASPTMTGASVLDNLGSYMSPYTKDVVDSALADYDFGAGQNEGQAKLDLAGDATFGGSGGSIGLAALRDAQSRGRGTLSAGLRDDAFRFGAGLSESDANRRQAASASNQQAELARLLANQAAGNEAGRYNAGAADTAAGRELAAAGGLGALGQAQGDQERANIGLQSDIGAILQAISQRQAGAGLGALAAEGGLWAGLPLDLLRGSNATGTMSGTSTGTGKESGATLGDWLSYFAANAQAAASSGGGG